MITTEASTVTPDERSEVEATLQPVDPAGTQVGKLSADLQNVFILLSRLIKELKDQTDDIARANFEDRVEAVQRFFWLMVRFEFDIVSAPEVGLAEEWKVVTLPPVCPHCHQRHEPTIFLLFGQSFRF